MLSKISETCYNFTGLNFDKLRRILMEYMSKKEYKFYIKNAEELYRSLEIEKNEWSRLPYDNNYRRK